LYIVTGGGSGIGRSLAQALARREKPVLIVGRHERPLVETAASYPLIEYLCGDVSTQEGRADIVSHVQDLPAIEGIIHNAGIIDPIVPITAIDESAWRQVMATNLEAPLFLTQALRGKLATGRVLHIGSGAAYFPVSGWAAYCVSKAALSMLTRCWQLECATIAFASVMPGIIDTRMQQKIRHAQHMDTEKRDFFNQLQRSNQLISPETVAEFLCWLLLSLDKVQFESREWDIYDTTHHDAWLMPPYVVPALE